MKGQGWEPEADAAVRIESKQYQELQSYSGASLFVGIGIAGCCAGLLGMDI